MKFTPGGATKGIQPLGSYTGSATAGAGLDKLLALIPNPDDGATAGGGFLDEMSPAAAAQLRVEIAALKDVIGDFESAA